MKLTFKIIIAIIIATCQLPVLLCSAISALWYWDINVLANSLCYSLDQITDIITGEY